MGLTFNVHSDLVTYTPLRPTLIQPCLELVNYIIFQTAIDGCLIAYDNHSHWAPLSNKLFLGNKVVFALPQKVEQLSSQLNLARDEIKVVSPIIFNKFLLCNLQPAYYNKLALSPHLIASSVLCTNKTIENQTSTLKSLGLDERYTGELLSIQKKFSTFDWVSQIKSQI